MSEVNVPLGERSYSVVLAPDFIGLGERIRRLGVRRVLVVTEPRVANHWLTALKEELQRSGLDEPSIVLPMQESDKSLSTWQTVVEHLLAKRVDRRTVVLAFGGGVVGDLVGFAASTVLRGVPVVQVPTTLLSMVDSSVGGKTAVNTSFGKNLVGSFHQPVLVWAPLCVLSTLEERQYIAGFGEVVKMALIADRALFEFLEQSVATLKGRSLAALEHVIHESVARKSEIVMQDETEQGVRKTLNAGHTVAHGIETATHHAVYHGEAVALGLVAEIGWAERVGLASGVWNQLYTLLVGFGLPVQMPFFPREPALAAMRLDKKNADGMLIVPVPTSVGTCTLATLPLADLECAFFPSSP